VIGGGTVYVTRKETSQGLFQNEEFIDSGQFRVLTAAFRAQKRGFERSRLALGHYLVEYS